MRPYSSLDFLQLSWLERGDFFNARDVMPRHSLEKHHEAEGLLVSGQDLMLRVVILLHSITSRLMVRVMMKMN